MTAADWPAVIGALDARQLPCSGAEQRMFRITASLGEGIPADLRETLTGINRLNVDLLITAMRHPSGQRR
jgi:hypothetical protein